MRNVLAAGLVASIGIASTAMADPAASDSDRWCAPELTSLSNEVCTFTPSHAASGPRTLVIFLHGVTEPGSNWQWTFQRAGARIAEDKGFTVIMPRGRRGVGPKGMEDWWTWPTSQAAQEKIESDVLAEWSAAQAELEAKNGQKFDRVWVFGFSNGAYYATSLAMRGKLASGGDTTHPIADGYAAFAGGSGASYLKSAAASTKTRPRFFVAWGGKDPAHGDQEELAAMLHALSWPSKSEAAKNAGHTATDKQLTDAVAFLSGETAPSAPEPMTKGKTTKSVAKKGSKGKGKKGKKSGSKKPKKKE